MNKKVLPKKKIIEVLDILKTLYPNAECALDFASRWQLLVAVALSAQTTDVSVNKASPALFSKYPTPEALAGANQEDVEKLIKKIGMYRQKSKNIIAMSKMLVDLYSGQVPEDYDALIKLPGVGRKTANVVLSVGFGEQRIAVDTHVFRVSNRIGLCHEKDVLDTEKALMKNIPQDRWSESHQLLIHHGRQVCKARKPLCETCEISHICQYYSGIKS